MIYVGLFYHLLLVMIQGKYNHIIFTRGSSEKMVVQTEFTENEKNELLDSNTELNKLINWLDEINSRPSLKVVEEKLLNLRINSTELSKYFNYTDDGYHRNVIKKTDNYELVLICWKAGQKTPIHDHRGSDCAFLILEGVCTETIFEISDGELKEKTERRYNPGEVCAADEPDIHRISNNEDGNLVNLHLYSPPLKKYNTY